METHTRSDVGETLELNVRHGWRHMRAHTTHTHNSPLRVAINAARRELNSVPPPFFNSPDFLSVPKPLPCLTEVQGARTKDWEDR